jgi:hypothetical protein
MAHIGETSVFDLNWPFDGEAFKEIVISAGYTETAMAEMLGVSGGHERQDLEASLRTCCRAVVRLDRIAPLFYDLARITVRVLGYGPAR